MSTPRASSKIDPQLIVKGVDQAMWAWLIEHSPITVPGLIEEAVQRSFTAWLDANKHTLLEMIADRIAKKAEQDKENPPGTV